MSTELVRVTIDERELHVPKGLGIVETALAAGVEIPVFCYEPRLGAPVGASSSSSSTTRSTARSATRAASARCRTSPSATGRATRA
jgi:predicted molibdopterin-dependent oxidoreductase YjgC